ncbi:MAG TPA: ATP-binding protein, partial [Candidatus Krumholzibacteria bacterium]|nr:ATP-binding protein [Candidatus Krumholzibacteria bacterium]
MLTNRDPHDSGHRPAPLRVLDLIALSIVLGSVTVSIALVSYGHADGQPHWLDMAVLAGGLTLAATLWYVRRKGESEVLDLLERARDEELLQTVAKGTSGATGEEFFRQLAASLARAFETRYAFVSRFDATHPEMGETLAFWDGDDFRPRIHYRIAGTPTERILQKGRYVMEDGVQDDFLDDELLHSMGVRSYAGTTLYDSDGEPCGALVVMDNRPFHQPRQRVDSILQLFAARAAAELIRLRSEQRIRRMNEELERRMVARTTELREAQDQLVQAEKIAALGTLVAGVAHEINGPVGIGVTAVTHLKDQLDDFASLYRDGSMTRRRLERFLEAACESAELVHSNLNRAADLVTVFKKVTADGGGQEQRRVRPRDHVRQVLHELQPGLSAGGHRVELRCDPELQIWTYPDVFTGIVTELVRNSVKHGFAGRREGCIVLTIEESGPSWRLTYEDDGQGLEPEALARIFDPFFTTCRGGTSTGLGMHILYNGVTRMLGGTVRCQSRPGEGMRVDVV